MKNNILFGVEEIAKKVKNVSYVLASLSTQEKNNILLKIADTIDENIDSILFANAEDIKNVLNKDSAFIDRLTLNKERILQISYGVRQIVKLNDPIGSITKSWTNEDGLSFNKVRSPLGVLGVIYEARPNVTVDVVALAIKSSNAIILRGGSDAIETNRCLYKLIIQAIDSLKYTHDFIGFIDDTSRDTIYEMLKLSEYIDVVIPRGGEKLKKVILENATMPVIGSAGGNCHIYVDSECNIEWAKSIVYNAKMQRPTVCNALEQLLVHKDAVSKLKEILEPLYNDGCSLIGDDASNKAYSKIVKSNDKNDFKTEHLAHILTVQTVDNLDDAIDIINHNSTHHSEAIISNNESNIQKFKKLVDSSCVYVNASTRFTDGFLFGFGAEIGISTQKLHARGPLGLEQLTSEKYVVVGNGDIRK